MSSRNLNKLLSAVRRGAKLLDERKPGWARKVRIRELDVADCEACVLGQVYGGYGKGVEALNLNGEEVTSMRYPGYLGFDMHPTVNHYELDENEFSVLDEAWKNEVRQRRAERSQRG